MKIDYPRARRRGVLKLLPSWRQLLLLMVLAVAGVVGMFAFAYASIDIPDPSDPTADDQLSIVYFRDGATEIGRLGETNRTAVRLDQVPEHVRNAVLAAEDRSFYSNNGISPRGITRAFVNNLRNDSTQGGSTITQQYVKNYYLTTERTLQRKLKEFVISVKVNRQTSKDDILENYLNNIYWGRGTRGVQAASEAYFGKSVGKVSRSEAAFLAGIIAAPEGFDPVKNPEGAERRWNYVLDGMVSTGAISQADRDKQTFPKIGERTASNRLGGPNGYLLAVVKDELARVGYDDAEVETGGLRITTTFSKKAQDAAVKAVTDNFPEENAEDVHAGLTSVVPGSGEVVAMYGGPDYVTAPGQNSALAQIQGGSTFKAYTLAAALEEDVSLDSRFPGNSPLDVPGSKPVNNSGDADYGYRVNLRYATAHSVNTAFVGLTLEVGAKAVRKAAVEAGLPDNTPGLEANARITLGTASVNSLEVANSYATFAANGLRAKAHTVLQVRLPNGGVDYRAKEKPERAFDADVAASVTDALTGVTEPGGTAPGVRADLGRPVAGKTGTAESTAAWFVGYTPQLSTAVGLYKGDGTEDLTGVGGRRNVYGGGFPTDMFTDYMVTTLEGAEELDFPEAEDIGDTVDPAPRQTRTSRPSPREDASPSPSAVPEPSTSAPAPDPQTTPPPATTLPPAPAPPAPEEPVVPADPPPAAGVAPPPAAGEPPAPAAAGTP